jgi:hypothetical protein
MPGTLSKLEELTLVLLHQTAFEEGEGWLRSWKGYDFQVMNRLHERGLISDPVGKRKSVYLTEQGRAMAEELLAVYVGPDAGALLARTCACGCGEEPSAGNAFRPGHDQRLRAALEARVGGLLALRAIVDAVEVYAHGRTSAEDLGRVLREVFSARLGRPAAEGAPMRPKPAASPPPRQASIGEVEEMDEAETD